MVDEYSKTDKLSINIASWNVGGNKPLETLDLQKWLLPDNFATKPDLLIIGFQEIISVYSSSLLKGNQSEKVYWKDLVMKCLLTHAPED